MSPLAEGIANLGASVLGAIFWAQLESPLEP
jgi:hypothetical protein